METAVRQTVVVPVAGLATPQTYAIVPHGETPPAKPTDTLATQLVDTYVEAYPKVALARTRYQELDGLHDRMVGIGVGPATLGVIVGMVAAMDAFHGSPNWWVLGACAAVVSAGGYIASLSSRLWKSGVEPAKAELEKARLEVRAELQGPDDLKSVAERLAGSHSAAA